MSGTLNFVVVVEKLDYDPFIVRDIETASLSKKIFVCHDIKSHALSES